MFSESFQRIGLTALVALLASVFVLQFGGPQAEGCSSGGSTYALKVDGDTINVGDYTAAYTALGFGRRSREEQYQRRLYRSVIDGLVERKLLADEARELGFSVDEEDVMLRFAEERSVRISLGSDSQLGGGGVEIPLGEQYGLTDRDGNFDIERARGYINNVLRRSVGEFTEMQMEEELAERMRQTIAAGVAVSEGEVWDAYVRDTERARIEYVRFAPNYYRGRVSASEDELRAWIGENEEQVQQEYEANRHRYTDLEEQVRASHILVRVSRDAAESVRDAARNRAENYRQRALAGEDFATLAREVSDDTASARLGGDLGYNPRGRMAREFDDAQFALENIGDLSEIVETTFGYHVIELTGRREGDVPEDEAKLELAERLYRDIRGAELAREAAQAALAELQAGRPMDELDAWLVAVERGETPPAFGADAEAAEAVEGEEPADETEAEPEPERDALAPQVQESRSFGPTSSNPIPVPSSEALVRAVFEMSMDAPLPDEPFEAGNEFIVYRLAERVSADRDDFDEDTASTIRQRLLTQKRREAVTEYTVDLRRRAQEDGRVRIRAFDLTLEVSGAGEVTSEPSGISCGDGETECTATYEFATLVMLRARATSGGRFLGWDGACVGSDETCVVALEDAREVSARFRRRPQDAESAPSMDAVEAAPSDDEATD